MVSFLTNHYVWMLYAISVWSDAVHNLYSKSCYMTENVFGKLLKINTWHKNIHINNIIKMIYNKLIIVVSNNTCLCIHIFDYFCIIWRLMIQNCLTPRKKNKNNEKPKGFTNLIIFLHARWTNILIAKGLWLSVDESYHPPVNTHTYTHLVEFD